MTNATPDAVDRRSFNFAALAIGGGVLLGFTFLPRIVQQQSDLVGTPAPDFTLRVLYPPSRGDRIHLAELKGKPVILSFWATWCRACRMEIPSLNRLAERLRDQDVMVVGVSVDDGPEAPTNYARQQRLSYPIVHDEGGAVGSKFGVRNLPTMVVVNREGIIRAIRSGLIDEGSLENLLAE